MDIRRFGLFARFARKLPHLLLLLAFKLRHLGGQTGHPPLQPGDPYELNPVKEEEETNQNHTEPDELPVGELKRGPLDEINSLNHIGYSASPRATS